MLNLTISTIVFFIAAWFLNNYLDAQGIPKGLTRGLMVIVLASLMSWGIGWTVDWAQNKAEGPQTSAQAPSGLTQLMKDAGQQRP
jgi:high-affinity Fe2+/Pb2+ permease